MTLFYLQSVKGDDERLGAIVPEDELALVELDAIWRRDDERQQSQLVLAQVVVHLDLDVAADCPVDVEDVLHAGGVDVVLLEDL